MVFDWDESFELDLVNNRELDLLIYSWDPQYRHKLCYKGSVYLPSLLKTGPLHQLALKIEPRGKGTNDRMREIKKQKQKFN